MDMVQDRTQRINLVKEVDPSDLYIKLVPHDLCCSPVFEYVSTFDEIICIERRDLFDTILSGIIAINTSVFNIEPGNNKPTYNPFKAKKSEYLFMVESIEKYFFYKQLLQPLIKKTYVYEELINEDLNNDFFQKLLTKEEKKQIITNWREVYRWWEWSWLYGYLDGENYF